MDENKPTTRQLILFGVILSFVVSILGTILTLGIVGPVVSSGEGGGTVLFNRPKILEKLTEVVTERETSERVLRQDELVVKVVEEASPAVVSVVASKDVAVIEQFFIDPFSDDPFFRQFFGDDSGLRVPQFRRRGTQRQEVSSGTGFFVSADGMLLTNKHVVADASADYTVLTNEGKKLSAQVLARDPLQDLAVLKVEGAGLPSLRLGDSNGIKIGQSVVAIGNALGEFRNTVSVGIVSGLGRSVVASGPGGSETLQELIQTDAAINPGNSGGPLLNLNGEVVGINTAMAQGAENIGFAIPINKAARGLASVRQSGRIIYPFLGIRYVLVTPQLAEQEKLDRDYGALLRSGESDPAVVAGSPAARAGLREGDIILEFAGERVTPERTLASLIQQRQVGEEVVLKFFRSGQETEVRVKLEERK